MASLLTPSPRPNLGGRIKKDGVTTNYAPSPAGGPSPTRNAGGTLTAPLAPGVSLTRSFAPSARASSAPGRPNAGGTMSTQLAPDVSMTRSIKPSASTMPGHSPTMNAGGSIDAPLAPGVTLQRSFQPSPLQSTGPRVNVPFAAPAQTGPAPAAQQTEQANPLTGDGGGEGQLEGQSETVDPGDAGDVPNLFSSRGAGAPRGDDALPGGENVGGTGLYARKFSNSRSANAYDQYTRGLFA